MDVWDEQKDSLRTFALDRMRQASVKDETARDVDSQALDQALMPGYGLFAGAVKAHAKLIFSKERSEWVSEETWHPDQRGRFLEDGSYELIVPFSDSRELLGEILRHASHVRVESPESLVLEVKEALSLALKVYENH